MVCEGADHHVLFPPSIPERLCDLKVLPGRRDSVGPPVVDVMSCPSKMMRSAVGLCIPAMT